MDLLSVLLPLLLVIDPFGNLPFVLAILGRLDGRRFTLAILREVTLAAMVLAAFALLGERLLLWFGIEQSSLHVAGGIVLFLIALKMIFGTDAELYTHGEQHADDPIAVPIAMPAIAGPSAMATVLFFASREDVSLGLLLVAIIIVSLVTLVILLIGRPIATWLGPRGLTALEKLSGMLLSVVAVNMMLTGLKTIF